MALYSATVSELLLGFKELHCSDMQRTSKSWWSAPRSYSGKNWIWLWRAMCRCATQLAAILTFVNGLKVPLPLSVSLRVLSTIYLSSQDQYFHQGWTIDHEAANGREVKRRNFYTQISNILAYFNASLVLHIIDVDMLFHCNKRALQWQPRRFSPVWTAYGTILHATWRRISPASPIVGLYSDLSLLVKRVRARGSQITFLHDLPACRPFQLYREKDFVLRHKISESDIPFDLINRVLRLDRICIEQEGNHTNSDEVKCEEQPGEDTQSGLRKKDLLQWNSKFLLLRSGERTVNDKPKCEFQTCPVPKFSDPRYCDIHSMEILRIASNKDHKAEIKGRGK